MNTNDFLYHLADTELHNSDSIAKTIEDLASHVVTGYLSSLAKQGVVVPSQLKPVLELDLIEEVVEFTRKKTYGFMSLDEYRNKKKSLR